MKAPRKKKYAVGGTIKGYNPPPEPIDESSNSADAKRNDFHRLVANQAFGGLNPIKQDKFQTKQGKAANEKSQIAQHVASQAGRGLLNYFIPGLGTMIGGAKDSINQQADATEGDSLETKNTLSKIDQTGGSINAGFSATGISNGDKNGIIPNKKSKNISSPQQTGIAGATSVAPTYAAADSTTPNPYAGQTELSLKGTTPFFDESKLSQYPALQNEYNIATTPEAKQAVINKVPVMKKGGVLKGNTHAQGGIEVAVKGGGKIEAENNEIVLTKGVYEDPHLRGIASAINVAAGGKPIDASTQDSFAKKGTVAKGDDKDKKTYKANTGIDPKKADQQKAANQKVLDKMAADKAISEIESLKKEVALYKGKGLADYAAKSQKKLDDLQARYSPKKDIIKDPSLSALPKPNTGIGAATSAYNNESEDSKYKLWKSKLPKNLQSESDYDLKGFWKENPNFSAKEGDHLTDKFKLPNHPTFSTESKYAVGANKAKAGTWDGDKFIPPSKSKLGIAGAIKQTAPTSTESSTGMKAASLADYNKTKAELLKQGEEFNASKTVAPAVQETPITTPTIAKEKELNGGKQALDWTRGIGAVQTGLGVASLIGDGTAPTYSANAQLINDADALRKEGDYGYNPLTLSDANSSIELARRTSNREAMNLTGGDAGSQLAFQTAGGLNTNKSYTDLAKDSETFRLQKKQAQYGMDQGIASEMKTAFDSNMALFDKRQMAGAQLTQSGIGNMIGAQRYQDAAKEYDKRTSYEKSSTLVGLTEADKIKRYKELKGANPKMAAYEDWVTTV